jgi:hypothetical protein
MSLIATSVCGNPSGAASRSCTAFALASPVDGVALWMSDLPGSAAGRAMAAPARTAAHG